MKFSYDISDFSDQLRFLTLKFSYDLSDFSDQLRFLTMKFSYDIFDFSDQLRFLTVTVLTWLSWSALEPPIEPALAEVESRLKSATSSSP